MVWFRRRGFFGLSSAVFLGVLAGIPVHVNRTDWEAWVITWPAHLFFLALFAAHWWFVGRHANRAVRVDDDGLWVGGELAVPASRIIAVVPATDTGTAELQRMGEVDRGAWVQGSWGRFTRPAGSEPVVVTRDRDLGRGTWNRGAIVTTDEYEPGEDFRKGWFVPAYRRERLLDALVAVAPHVDAPVDD